MICAQCVREVAAGAQRCDACAEEPLLDGRYRLDRRLTSDPSKPSYRATRTEDGLLVRARARPLAGMPPGTTPREFADALRELDHVAVPRLLDDFICGEGEAAMLWLIHEHLRGQTLAERLAAMPDHRLGERQVIAMVHELAAALAYLHGRRPAWVRAQLSPETVLLHGADDHACLLDLDPWPAEAGAAGRAADVMALGSIALVALTGLDRLEPSDGGEPAFTRESSPVDGGSSGGPPPAWRERVVVGERFMVILETMLDSDPGRRAHAPALAEALAALRAWLRRPFATPERTDASAARVPTSTPSSARRVHSSKLDAPIMRPEELSRELSSAHRAAASFATRQQTHLTIARVLVVIIAAVIAALTTYLALALRGA